MSARGGLCGKARCPLIRPFGHLVPEGRRVSGDAPARPALLPSGRRCRQADEGAGVWFGAMISPTIPLSPPRSRCPLIRPFGHLLPKGRRVSGDAPARPALLPSGRRCRQADEGAGVWFGAMISPTIPLSPPRSRCPLIRPFGHLLPEGRRVSGDAPARPALLPAGRRCRQADEGACLPLPSPFPANFHAAEPHAPTNREA
ncbi:hypothetical protein SAMN05880582_106213 [Rhizobium sp. RU20A]|nr:hypothetical protein SAMN05880582_106213 [Rhizobium sp. RU20A]